MTTAQTWADGVPSTVDILKADPQTARWLYEATDTAGAAKLVGLAPCTLNDLRSKGGGPPYRKIGLRVVYVPRDVLAWREAHARISTSDSGKKGGRVK